MLGKVKNVVLFDDYFNSKAAGVAVLYEKENGETGVDFRAGNSRYDMRDELRRIQRMGYGIDDATRFTVSEDSAYTAADAKTIVNNMDISKALYSCQLKDAKVPVYELHGMAYGFDDADGATCLSQSGYLAYDVAMDYLYSDTFEDDRDICDAITSDVIDVHVPPISPNAKTHRPVVLFSEPPMRKDDIIYSYPDRESAMYEGALESVNDSVGYEAFRLDSVPMGRDREGNVIGYIHNIKRTEEGYANEIDSAVLRDGFVQSRKNYERSQMALDGISEESHEMSDEIHVG